MGARARRAEEQRWEHCRAGWQSTREQGGVRGESEGEEDEVEVVQVHVSQPGGGAPGMEGAKQ